MWGQRLGPTITVAPRPTIPPGTQPPPPTEPSSGEPTTTTASTGTTAPPQTTAAPATTSQTTQVALPNCDTNIGQGVPLFYSTYFRCVDMTLDGDAVVISSADLPPHMSYYHGEGSELFEPFDTSRGTEYRPNPNQIMETRFTLRIPLSPVPVGVAINGQTVNLTPRDPTDYPMGVAGVALDGVALFNPLARPGDDIADERFTFDSNKGHPQEQGAYHYHAGARGPLRVLQSLGFTTTDVLGQAEIELYGIMCDGTVVMGLAELDRSNLGGRLDLQAGHAHDIVDTDGNVLLEDRYHVHISPTIGAEPRGLTPEAQYYTTCDVTGGR